MKLESKVSQMGFWLNGHRLRYAFDYGYCVSNPSQAIFYQAYDRSVDSGSDATERIYRIYSISTFSIAYPRADYGRRTEAFE